MKLEVTRLSLATLIASVAAGCATTSQFPGAALDGASGGIVKGVGGTVGSFLATALQPIGASKEILLFKVNGVRVNALGSTALVRLIPGKHQLSIRCAFSFDGRLIQDGAELTAEIEAGHVYQVDATPPCNASVTDMLAPTRF